MGPEASLRNKAAIVGIGHTEYSKASGRSELRLALEAAQAAIDDAGLARREIDGLMRFGVVQSGASEAWMATNLGLDSLSYWGSVDYGGSAAPALIGHAAAAVSAGLADYVLCYRSLNGRSGLRPGTSDTYDQMLRGADPSYDNYLLPYGLTAPVETYAMIAQRHMHEYGTTSRQLGRIAVSCRENANANPDAQMHDRVMTMEDYEDSPVISDPLRIFDCCLQTDGAAAVLVTTMERAKELRHPPVVIAGATQGALPDTQGPLHSLLARPDITETSAVNAAHYLWRQTGLSPGEIDVAQFYDCFTVTVLLQLEDYGFCSKGESGPFVEDGNIAYNGALPINTDGGNLSGGYIHGMNHVLEGTKQVRGTSTRQVDGAQTCLVTAGTPAPTSALVLAGEPV